MHQVSIGDKYTPPSWSAKPTYSYFLEIIKSGVPIEEIDISYKQFILLGKYPDLCDVVMQHPTVSRIHAVIQHKNTGEIFLYDLGSSHGTFVNNKQLPSKIFHALHPYDSIRFASSTRTYILRCNELEEKDQQEQMKEEELEQKNNTKITDSNNLNEGNQSKEVLGDTRIRTPKELKKAYVELRDNDPYYKQQNKGRKLQGGPAQVEGKNEKKKEDAGISWGMSDEQEVYDYFDENQIALIPDLLRRLPNLTEKQVEKIDKYEERLAKYNAQEQELEQIVQKERKEYGLEDKLKERKEKIQAKLLEVQTNLELAENNVRLSLFGEVGEESEEVKRKKAAVKFDNVNLFGDEEDDEEYFDRSKVKKLKIDPDERKRIALSKLENTTDNYWGLKKKLEKLMGERHELNKIVLGLNEKKDTNNNGDEEDELDAYMKETEAKLDKESREKHFIKIRDLNAEIQLVSDMLQYIKPDIQIDYEQFEKSLDSTSVFTQNNTNNDDEDDEEGLVRNNVKNSIIKDNSNNNKLDRIASELQKLKEIKKRRQDLEKETIKSSDKEINEDLLLQIAQEELIKQEREQRGMSKEFYQKYKEEFGEDGEDAPLFIETAQTDKSNNKQKVVYKAADKPVNRNIKITKDQEACVDLTYMESMEDCTDTFNNIMNKKYGY